jgi:hypothetical protein
MIAPKKSSLFRLFSFSINANAFPQPSHASISAS